MQLIALGGDLRMNGLLRAARRAGISCRHIKEQSELETLPQSADALVLPWPRSIVGGFLACTQIRADALNERLPLCDVLMGGEISESMIGCAKAVFNPSQDEAFLLENTLKESVKLSELVVFVTAILSLPLHEAVFARSNRASLRCHHVAHDADAVVDKHAGDFLHVITNLLVGFGNVCLFS